VILLIYNVVVVTPYKSHIFYTYTDSTDECYILSKNCVWF